MPRYFLHIREGAELIEDAEGMELPSLEAARAEALESARCILADRVRNGRPIGRGTVEVTDETGAVLAYLPLRAALDLS
ncbi:MULTISPECIES: DUF6894 family protein [Methylobacterium]|uniref:DUF6894 family protein n=1 Tax=Methylobacterium TaxID=407 RepID=UPI0011C7EBDC|nr:MULTISPECIES: hypothetical protein [Methylobacterium]TXN21780.1 hypothetical protein FV217_13300 [Methylobacterium sp. WL9]